MDSFIDIFLHIDQHLVALVQNYRAWTYVLLFMIIFCETGLVFFPFLPGDSLLFVSGAVASIPGMPLEISLLILVLFIAAVLGDSCNYLIGHSFGKKMFGRSDSRIFKQSHLEKTHHFFSKIWWKNDYHSSIRSHSPYFCTVCCRNGAYALLYIYHLQCNRWLRLGCTVLYVWLFFRKYSFRST